MGQCIYTCETLAVVIRFISDSWITENLIQLLAKSLAGKEITCEVISLPLTEFGIGLNYLISAMRNQVSENNVAMRS